MVLREATIDLYDIFHRVTTYSRTSADDATILIFNTFRRTISKRAQGGDLSSITVCQKKFGQNVPYVPLRHVNANPLDTLDLGIWRVLELPPFTRAVAGDQLTCDLMAKPDVQVAITLTRVNLVFVDTESVWALGCLLFRLFFFSSLGDFFCYLCVITILHLVCFILANSSKL